MWLSTPLRIECGELRLFGKFLRGPIGWGLVRSGSWVSVNVDHAAVL